MDILLKVLEELGFSARDDFSVKNINNSQKSFEVNVKIRISKENQSQVFLIIECNDEQLVDFVDGKIIKDIALKFRQKEYHRAEMDKNTTLIIVSKHDNETIDLSSKVKIEDDPYYFKKYVFSYDDVGLENAKLWLSENAKRRLVVELIQEYITDTEHFASYKKNHQNESTYTFFIELATKLHCFPMRTADTKNIRSVKDLLDDEVNMLRNKPKKPIFIDLERLDAFIESNIDFENSDEVFLKWNLLYEQAGEGR